MFPVTVSVFILILRLFFAQATDCPDLWIPFDGSCYRFGHQAVTFFDAEHYCQQHESHLVHIEGKTENDFLKDELGYLKNENYWIGLTDDDIEGRWVWYGTDSVAQFLDWSPGQPDSHNNANEDCGELGVYPGHSIIQWHDLGCSALRLPLCEKSENTAEVIG